MMTDLARIKRNVAKMAGMNAPEADIDGYIASEGVSLEQVRSYRLPDANGASVAPEGLRPGTAEYAQWAAQEARNAVANGQRPNLPQVSADPNSADMRYKTALERTRASQFPDMTDEQWADYSQVAFAPSLQAQGQQSQTFGFADEMGAAIGGLGAEVRKLTGGGGNGFSEAYDTLYEMEQARLELAREQNGGLGTAVEVLSGLGVAGPMAAATGGPIRQLLTAAPAAVGSGAAYGFGSTDGDLAARGQGALIGGGVGAAGAMAAPLIGKVIQGTGRRLAQVPVNRANQAAARQAVANAPTAASIKATSSAAYKAAERTGVEISQPAMAILAQDMGDLAKVSGLVFPDGSLSGAYPKVKHALEAIGQYAQGPLSVEQRKVLLRTLRAAQKSIDPDEARLGTMLVNQFEDFMDNLPANAYSKNGGKGAEASRLYAEGRTEWARSKRTQTIEDIVETANLKGGNVAQNLRNGFKAILKPSAAKKRRGFTAQELAAMRRFADGGPIDDLLQYFGSGSGIPGGIVGGISGGVAGAVALPLVGMGARKLANNQARKGAELLRAQVATPGGLPPMRQLPPPIPMPRLAGPAALGVNILDTDRRNQLLQPRGR